LVGDLEYAEAIVARLPYAGLRPDQPGSEVVAPVSQSYSEKVWLPYT